MTVASASERLNGFKHRIKRPSPFNSIIVQCPMNKPYRARARALTGRVSDPTLDSVRLWMERCQSIEKPLIICNSLLEAELKWTGRIGWTGLS